MAEAPAAGLGHGTRNPSFREPFQLTALDVLTANINGDKGRRYTPRSDLKVILEHFFHEHQPDVILVQENLWSGNNIKSHLASIGGNYNAETTQFNQIKTTVLHRLTNSPKLERMDNNLHYEMVKRIEKGKIKLTYPTLLDRARIVSFVAKGPFPKEPEPHLIAISWHGPHFRPQSSKSAPAVNGRTGTEESDAKEYKKKLLRDLLEIVNYLNMEFYSKSVPVILGGDFNIDYKDVQGLIEEYELQSLEYPKPPSGQKLRQIDFFIVTSDVTLNRVYTIPYEMDPDGEIFGHVPVMARLTLTCTVRSSLRKQPPHIGRLLKAARCEAAVFAGYVRSTVRKVRN